MRTKYGIYPEYHTSLDDLNLVTPSGLYGGYSVLKNAIGIVEANRVLKCKNLCEPQLGKRGLYPNISEKGSAASVELMMNVLTYLDGTIDLLDLADKLSVDFWEVKKITDKLFNADLLEESN
jgi:aminopeptidase-like protein